ncbi:MAG TPA: hypothetical protein VMK12_09995 [Anaeromyxobacteraceae bacterium]|nr:hypothetical protein [Anaeromyxobacteraceae bacterium]
MPPSVALAIGAVRLPLFFADVDRHALKLVGIHELGRYPACRIIPRAG